MHSLDTPTKNQTAELVAEIEEIAAERERLLKRFSIHDAMISCSPDITLALSGTMQRIWDEDLADTDQRMENAILQLEQIQPDHELVTKYREEYKKVA